MAKRVSKLQEEYKRVRRNLLQKVRRAEKRGYIFESEVVPKIPKKITKGSINRLQKISSKLYQKAEFLDVETGEILTSKEGRKLEKQRSRRKAQERKRKAYTRFPSEAEIVISNFRSDVVTRFPESAEPILSSWLNSVIQEHGENAVAQMLQNAQNSGIVIDAKVAYNEELLLGAIADMLDFLPDIESLDKAYILDQLEIDEDWENPE